MSWIIVKKKEKHPAITEGYSSSRFENPEEEAASLAKQGYAVISKKHRTVARVDRWDWRMTLAAERAPPCADWYRRNISEDKLKVSSWVLPHMPRSSDFAGPDGDIVWDGE